MRQFFLASLFLATNLAYAMLPTPETTPPAQALPQGVFIGDLSNTVPSGVVPTAIKTEPAHTNTIAVATTQNPTPTTAMPTSAVITPAQIEQAMAEQANIVANSQMIELVVHAFLVAQDGSETLTPITQGMTVQAGDVVEYRGYFINRSPDRIRSMSALLEIPSGAELIGGIEPMTPSATVDGTRFVRMPLRTKVDGQLQDVPLSFYKALRWDIEDVGIGGTAMVKYRAKIQ